MTRYLTAMLTVFCVAGTVRAGLHSFGEPSPTEMELRLSGVVFAAPIRCDFNEDGDLSVLDLQVLTDNLGGNDLQFDVNGDSVFDIADRNTLIHGKLGLCLGDANADGTFDSSDLVQVFREGQYEIDTRATWWTGDWNGDGYFNSSDLVAALQQPCAIPEPSSFLVFGAISAAFLLRHWLTSFLS